MLMGIFKKILDLKKRAEYETELIYELKDLIDIEDIIKGLPQFTDDIINLLEEDTEQYDKYDFTAVGICHLAIFVRDKTPYGIEGWQRLNLRCCYYIMQNMAAGRLNKFTRGLLHKINNAPNSLPLEVKTKTEELMIKNGEQILSDNSLKETTLSINQKPGRNELCPCGSNIKYKNCHGKVE